MTFDLEIHNVYTKGAPQCSSYQNKHAKLANHITEVLGQKKKKKTAVCCNKSLKNELGNKAMCTK